MSNLRLPFHDLFQSMSEMLSNSKVLSQVLSKVLTFENFS